MTGTTPLRQRNSLPKSSEAWAFGQIADAIALKRDCPRGNRTLHEKEHRQLAEDRGAWRAQPLCAHAPRDALLSPFSQRTDARQTLVPAEHRPFTSDTHPSRPPRLPSCERAYLEARRVQYPDIDVCPPRHDLPTPCRSLLRSLIRSRFTVDP